MSGYMPFEDLEDLELLQENTLFVPSFVSLDDPLVELRGLVVDLLRRCDGEYQDAFIDMFALVDKHPYVVHHPSLAAIRLQSALQAIRAMQLPPTTDTFFFPVTPEMVVLVLKWSSSHKQLADPVSQRRIHSQILLDYPLYCRQCRHTALSVTTWLKHQHDQHDGYNNLECQLVQAVVQCKQDNSTVLPLLTQHEQLCKQSNVLRHLDIPSALTGSCAQVHSVECMRVVWAHSTNEFCTVMAKNHPFYCTLCNTVCSNIGYLHTHDCVP